MKEHVAKYYGKTQQISKYAFNANKLTCSSTSSCLPISNLCMLDKTDKTRICQQVVFQILTRFYIIKCQ